MDHSRQIIGRSVLALALATGLVTTEATMDVQSVAASVQYPDADAVDCTGQFGQYSWCKDEDGNGSFSGGEQNSPRGYDYRNCTDWVAFRMPQLVGKSVPHGWGNARYWDDAARAAGYAVDNHPEPGDIAVWEGVLGHVEAVEAVNENGTVDTSGYNRRADGRYGTQSGVVADSYIDLNGPGKGLQNQPVAGSASHSPNDLIWQQNNNIFKFDGDNNFSTTSYTGGIATPNWAAPMDYNRDGRDDIVMYRKSDGTIRVVTNNPSGGWASHADNPVRGPGFGEPAWARVGDLDGDGHKDDIAWWTAGGNVHKLSGPNFTTSSYTSGIQPANWAELMDYNGDGRDDIVMYRQHDGTIRVLLNNPSGGWSGHPQNPVRGPGVGRAVWAEVGDLDGDGKAKEIAWWTPAGRLYKFHGPNFTTASYNQGMEPPDWADIMDYNKDGRDDVVAYRQNDGTLRVVTNNTAGGWSGHPDNPIRGPGIGAPDWAAAANLG